MNHHYDPRESTEDWNEERTWLPEGEKEHYLKGQHRMPASSRAKEAALNAFWFTVTIGRGLEVVLAIALAMFLLVAAGIGSIQIYDHFVR